MKTVSQDIRCTDRDSNHASLRDKSRALLQATRPLSSFVPISLIFYVTSLCLLKRLLQVPVRLFCHIWYLFSSGFPLSIRFGQWTHNFVSRVTEEGGREEKVIVGKERRSKD